MPDTLLQRIWFSCRHQFSWPRRSDNGDYYQVCLECGVKYSYDWHAMRRTARLDETEASASALGRKPMRKCSGKNGWHPRERRLRTQVPVQFRVKGATGEWRTAQSENISRSGLLFSVEGETPATATDIELVFLMPAEICGTDPADVLCQARVVRVSESSRHQRTRVAAAISDYVFLPKVKVG